MQRPDARPATGPGEPSPAEREARLLAEVEARFGVVPSFFREGALPVREELWRRAKAAYLDAPMPALLKERLFTWLSRYCDVPYCLLRHAAFLVGLGRPSGDPAAEPLERDDVIALLQRTLPDEEGLRLHAERFAAAAPLGAWPEPGDPLDESLFACAGALFLGRPAAGLARDALRTALGDDGLDHLLLLLDFVRSAHDWTRQHPALPLEDDVEALLAEETRLADWIRGARGTSPPTIAIALRDQLSEMRARLDELRVVHEVSAAVASAAEPERIHRAAMDGMVQALGVERASLLLFDEEGVMRFAAWRGLSDGYRAAVEGHSPWHPGERGAQPIAVVDAAEDPRLGAASEAVLAEGIRSLLFVPVQGEGRLLGKFMLYRDRPHDWKDSEVRLAQTIANHVGYAIARAARESELVQKTAALEEADRRKDHFLAVLGHELRNPLAALASGARLLRSGVDAENEAWARGMMSEQIETMGRLLDDLLDVGRIAAGKIELRRERTLLADAVERSVASVRSLAEEKEIDLDVDVRPPDLALEADPRRVEQVLANLLGNAVRYTSRGGHVRLEGRRDGGGVTVRVVDDGAGLDGAELERVFEAFTQGTASRASAGGLGLGLTLVRQLVELHGGRVTAASEGLGRGSTFTVRLPGALGAAPEPPAPAPEDEAAGGELDVLLVDDNQDAARALALLLRSDGWSVRTAGDAAGAVREVEARRPDLLLLDLGLPDRSGYDVAAELRERGLRPRCLVALTGFGNPEARERAAAAGFDRHLLKPVEPETLRGLLRELSAPAPPDPAAARRAAGGAGA